MSALSQQYDAAQYHLLADQLEHRDDQGEHRRRPAAGGEGQGAPSPRRPSPTTSPTARRRRRTRSSAATRRPWARPTEYNKIAEGDITLAVDNLHTAENTLNAQEAQLQGEQAPGQTQVNAEQDAGQRRTRRPSAAEERAGPGAGSDRHARQAAAGPRSRRRRQGRPSSDRPRPPPRRPVVRAARAARSWRRLSQAAPPPTAPGGAGAVQAAESQIGVPYVWGAESPKGSASPDSTAPG